MYTKPMYLDRKLIEEIPIHPLAREYKDAFGIEIEVEGINIRTEDPKVRKYWGMHEDGSLRAHIAGRDNGLGQTCEYVSTTPLPENILLESLKTLFDFFNSLGVTVFPSYRTSIHVHVNCAMETWRTIYNYVTLSIIFDELFVSQNGEHRIGNNFCLRFVDAEAPIDSLVESMSNFGNIKNLSSNMRYSSTNFASLSKFGTIEFRSMECHTNFERINCWVKTLQRLKEAARGFQSPKEIINLFSQYNETEFGYHILDKYFNQYSAFPEHKKMLRRGMRLAQDFAYSSTWESSSKAEQFKEDEIALRKKAVKMMYDWADAPQPVPYPNWVAPNIVFDE